MTAAAFAECTRAINTAQTAADFVAACDGLSQVHFAQTKARIALVDRLELHRLGGFGGERSYRGLWTALR